MKIRPVGAELFHGDGQTDRHDGGGRPASSVVAVQTAVCFREVGLSDLSCLQTAVAGCVL